MWPCCRYRFGMVSPTSTTAAAATMGGAPSLHCYAAPSPRWLLNTEPCFSIFFASLFDSLERLLCALSSSHAHFLSNATVEVLQALSGTLMLLLDATTSATVPLESHASPACEDRLVATLFRQVTAYLDLGARMFGVLYPNDDATPATRAGTPCPTPPSGHSPRVLSLGAHGVLDGQRLLLSKLFLHHDVGRSLRNLNVPLSYGPQGSSSQGTSPAIGLDVVLGPNGLAVPGPPSIVRAALSVCQHLLFSQINLIGLSLLNAQDRVSARCHLPPLPTP